MATRRAAALLLLLAACGREGNAPDAAVGMAHDLAFGPADGAHPPKACQGDNDCSGTMAYCDRSTLSCVVCKPPTSGCVQGEVCHNLGVGEWKCEKVCRDNQDCSYLFGGSLCCGGQCVNPATDVKNCGACGTVCPAPANGSPACSQGHCVICSCNPGYDDCDHDLSNCCETTTANDPNNCGKCGNVCKPYANGLATCTNGVCSPICAPGHADCNNRGDDGCETDVTFDVRNCGGCGKECGAPVHATRACDLGKCSFRCDLDFDDCDAMPANGCETDVRVDPLNCGHCGNVCGPNQSCIAKRCQ